MKAFWQDRVEPAVVTHSLGWKGWVFCLAVFLVAALALGSMQFQKQELLDVDAYYHTRAAQILSEVGVLQQFPWTQASVWKDHYADKEFLFHVLLIPFLGSDLMAGPKLLTVLLAAFLFFLMAFVFLRLGYPWPWLWCVLLLGAGVMFLYRMNLTRPHLLAIPLCLLSAYLMMRRRSLWLFLVSWLFPLCYTAAHLLPCLALLYGLACLIHKERFPWRMLLLVVLGTFLGLAFHPQSGNIFHLWYLQNIKVVLNAWRLTDEMGDEFLPPDGRLLVWDAGMILLCLIGPLMWFMLSKKKASLETTFLFLAAAGFFGMFLNILRFVEYWVPFTVWFAASATSELLPVEAAKAFFLRHRLVGPVLLAAGLLLLLGGMLRSVMLSQEEVRRDTFPHFKEEALWISRHVPAGQTVFTCNWDVSPFLLFYAPQQYSLVALDPTFMQAKDADLFEVWRRVARGLEPDAARVIPRQFNARWVLAERRLWNREFVAQAKRDPRFFLAFDGTEGAVYALPPDPRPLGSQMLQAGAQALIPGPMPMLFPL